MVSELRLWGGFAQEPQVDGVRATGGCSEEIFGIAPQARTSVRSSDAPQTVRTAGRAHRRQCAPQAGRTADSAHRRGRAPQTVRTAGWAHRSDGRTADSANRRSRRSADRRRAAGNRAHRSRKLRAPQEEPGAQVISAPQPQSCALRTSAPERQKRAFQGSVRGQTVAAARRGAVRQKNEKRQVFEVRSEDGSVPRWVRSAGDSEVVRLANARFSRLTQKSCALWECDSCST